MSLGYLWSHPPHAALSLCSFSSKHQHCYSLLKSRYRQDASKILFSLFSQNKNRAKLSQHFKLQEFTVTFTFAKSSLKRDNLFSPITTKAHKVLAMMWEEARNFHGKHFTNECYVTTSDGLVSMRLKHFLFHQL